MKSSCIFSKLGVPRPAKYDVSKLIETEGSDETPGLPLFHKTHL